MAAISRMRALIDGEIGARDEERDAGRRNPSAAPRATRTTGTPLNTARIIICSLPGVESMP